MRPVRGQSDLRGYMRTAKPFVSGSASSILYSKPLRSARLYGSESMGITIPPFVSIILITINCISNGETPLNRRTRINFHETPFFDIPTIGMSLGTNYYMIPRVSSCTKVVYPYNWRHKPILSTQNGGAIFESFIKNNFRIR